MKQADVYRWIIESYKENVPATQQSGFTIWSLSDHADEHTGWFTGDTPNLFDANYARKPAYKGVCDGIAGRDISELHRRRLESSLRSERGRNSR